MILHDPKLLGSWFRWNLHQFLHLKSPGETLLITSHFSLVQETRIRDAETRGEHQKWETRGSLIF